MLRQRKAKEKKKCTEDDQKPSDCIICLDEVSCRGKLSVCDHWFCFHCIFEWSKNTNTCPVCKARFRCITKTHVNALKSPPHKLRVKDVDQRVWNEDDSIVAEDYADYSEDDFDDDYEPSPHVANPWTRQINQSVRRARLDEYDLDDTFIVNDEDEDDDDDGDEDEDSVSDNTDSDDKHADEPITKPYSLRSNGPALTISLPDSDDSSSTSTGSFIASEDDNLDDSDTAQWMLPGQITQRSRHWNKSQHCRVDKKPTKGSTSQTINPARKMLRSQRTVSSAVVSTTSKRKPTGYYTSDEEDQTDGWINMTQRRENMRAARSGHSPRRQSRRGKGARKTGQRSVRQESSDSEGTDGDLLCSRNNSCRPKRTSRNENPKNSSSNHCLTTSEKQMSKQQTFATGAAPSDGLWESDSEEFLPSKTSFKGKGKGKGKCLDKGNSGEHYSRVTNEPLVISSDEIDSDPLSSMPSTSRGKSQQADTIMVTESSNKRLIRGSASWGNVSNTGPQGEQDSESNDILPRCNVTMRKRRNDAKKTKNESSTAVVMGWNKENLGCSTSEHGRNRCKTLSLTGEENCISPTPPSRRYYSIFTKRCHRSPYKTFDSCDDDVDAGALLKLSYKSTKLKIALEKLPENVNNVPTKHNAHARVELENSPTVQAKRKRRRLVDLDSD